MYSRCAYCPIEGGSWGDVCCSRHWALTTYFHFSVTCDQESPSRISDATRCTDDCYLGVCDATCEVDQPCEYDPLNTSFCCEHDGTESLILCADGSPYGSISTSEECEWGCEDGACKPDPCLGVVCDPDLEKCIKPSGTCVPKCYGWCSSHEICNSTTAECQEKCLNVVCESHQVCYRETGECVPKCHDDGPDNCHSYYEVCLDTGVCVEKCSLVDCGENATCANRETGECTGKCDGVECAQSDYFCVPNTSECEHVCDGVECDEGYYCSWGNCKVEPLCRGVVCPTNELCQESTGKCLPEEQFGDDTSLGKSTAMSPGATVGVVIGSSLVGVGFVIACVIVAVVVVVVVVLARKRKNEGIPFQEDAGRGEEMTEHRPRKGGPVPTFELVY